MGNQDILNFKINISCCDQQNGSQHRHEISSIPSADRFQGQKFPLTGIYVLVTRGYQFPQNFRSQCPRIRTFFHV